MTKLILAPDALEQLPPMLNKYRCRHCLIVASNAARNSALLQRLSTNLSGTHEVFTPSGTLPQMSEAIRCHQERGTTFDAIVALGGGRIIDTAKAISLSRNELQNFFNDPTYNLRGKGSVPLFAVPTLAGSGSEVTPFAVSYKDGLKHSLSHPALAPAAAIIDPQLMLSVPPLQRAVSGVDSIAHGIEAMLSKRATEMSDAFARKAVDLGHRLLFKSQRNTPEDFSDLFSSSIAGGRAIATTRTTIPHALSYYFTSVHGIPHGHAVGLSMGRYLHRFGSTLRNDRDLGKWSKNYEYILHRFGASNPADLECIWNNNLERLGLPVSLSKLGIEKLDLNELSQHVNADRFANSPLQLTVEEATNLLVP